MIFMSKQIDINRITDLLSDAEVKHEMLSNNDIYIHNELDIEELETLFDSIEGYEIKFVRSEPIIYN